MPQEQVARHDIDPDDPTDDEIANLMTRSGAIDWSGYIHADPAISFGKPVVRGTRLAVEFVLELYAAGWTDEQVLENYPRLTPEAIRAVFAFAAECVAEQRSVDRHRPPVRPRA